MAQIRPFVSEDQVVVSGLKGERFAELILPDVVHPFKFSVSFHEQTARASCWFKDGCHSRLGNLYGCGFTLTNGDSIDFNPWERQDLKVIFSGKVSNLLVAILDVDDFALFFHQYFMMFVQW